MALTATLAVLPQGEQPGRQCVATLTVTNGGGSAVGVVSVRPYIASFGSAQDQNVPANIGMVTPPPPNNLGAGDVLQFSFPFVVLASAQVDEIAEVIRDYGEERFAFPIAKAIVARRQASGPLGTTLELAQLVASVVKTREAGQDPATRTFQALRIFINAELEELQQALDASLRLLVPGGRLVVISFHSLEDRIVKQFMAKHTKEVFDRRAPFAVPPAMKLRTLDRIKPSAAEVAANPRSRSAILRVAERTEVLA